MSDWYDEFAKAIRAAKQAIDFAPTGDESMSDVRWAHIKASELLYDLGTLSVKVAKARESKVASITVDICGMENREEFLAYIDDGMADILPWQAISQLEQIWKGKGE